MRLREWICVAALIASAVVFASPRESFAQASPTTSCDPEYAEALESRAWLEAQREIAQNQNLILKPDSVLEYSCFGNALGILANADLFSEVGCCGGPGLGSTSLDDALGSVVGDAITEFLDNFDHEALGGRAPGYGYPSTNLSGFSHTCYLMKQIWWEAKCMNMIDEPSHDGFYDFDWYASKDPRKLDSGNPAACPVPGDYGSIIAVAFNGDQARYVLPAASDTWPPNGTPYTIDPVLTHFNLILPVGVAPATTCAPPIPTGICVKRNNMSPYMDAVCPNPGCHYVASPGSCSSVGSCAQ